MREVMTCGTTDPIAAGEWLKAQARRIAMGGAAPVALRLELDWDISDEHQESSR